MQGFAIATVKLFFYSKELTEGKITQWTIIKISNGTFGLFLKLVFTLFHIQHKNQTRVKQSHTKTYIMEKCNYFRFFSSFDVYYQKCTL